MLKLRKGFFHPYRSQLNYSSHIFVGINKNGILFFANTRAEIPPVIVDSENAYDKKDIILKFKDESNLEGENRSVIIRDKYVVDDTFSSYITTRRKFLNFFSYDIKTYQDNMLYKKSNGCENAFLYSTKIKQLKYSDRISTNIYVHIFNSHYDGANSLGDTAPSFIGHNKFFFKKSLFDILFKKYSLVYFFTDTNHISEMGKYLNDFVLQNKKKCNIEQEIINTEGCFIKLKKNAHPIHLFYCYVPPYKFFLSTYFTKKIALSLRNAHFDNANNRNFFFLTNKLNAQDENALLLSHTNNCTSHSNSNSNAHYYSANNSLPSLLLFDEHCYVRYHIKGLYTNEASHYLFNVLLNI
ncbi:conserved Plasmodium protein, unknown function [Plasmodium malariae]|uniref:Uncharacterized protein n=1 Tax=Plasmodium malariae TaxID=5858 RepID=A0A1C3L341_PLAMA|nr:conserved Plasmodium protein, unknown function [Plasmodium malariae]